MLLLLFLSSCSLLAAKVLVLVLVLVYSELSMFPDAAGTYRDKEMRDPGGQSRTGLIRLIIK